MKNNILIFTTIFFGIFTFAQEEPETIVPDNPEQLVNDSIDIQSGTIKNLQQAQERIDKLDTESKRLTNEYKDTIVEFEILNKYDNQLERITISQAEEIANITKQIEDLDETNKYVLPLLERMVITLRDLIEIDVPFLMDERMARLEELEDILFKANFSTAEKFRKVFEAYQLEAAFGNTIETYPGFIELDDQTITVDYFRIGRLGWYYRSANGRETGYWDKFNEAWVHTNGKLNDEIKLALDIANRQTPPNFISLPVQPVEK